MPVTDHHDKRIRRRRGRQLRDESVTDEVCLEVDQIFIYAPVKTNLTVIQQIFLVSWNKNKIAALFWDHEFGSEIDGRRDV